MFLCSLYRHPEFAKSLHIHKLHGSSTFEVIILIEASYQYLLLIFFLALLSQESDSNTSFKELLLQHIDLAHSSGFDDSIGRNSAAGIFNVGGALPFS